MSLKTILCIEDHRDYQFLLRKVLKDFNTIFADSLGEAKKIVEESPVHLILLDINLPDGDGLRFFSLLKASDKFKNIPVIFLSSSVDVSNKLMAFNLGAEDYICKPVDPLELVARVQARMKKIEEASSGAEVIRLHDLWLHMEQHRAFRQTGKGTEAIELTPKEFRILQFMMQNVEIVFSREHLLERLWGLGTHVVDRTVDTHISNLRKKLQETQITINSIVGEGYRLTRKQSES